MPDPIPQVFIGPQDPSQFGWGGSFPANPAGQPTEPQYGGADLNALVNLPPGYSSDPVTGAITGPGDAFVGPPAPTPSQSQNVTPDLAPWFGGFGAMANPFFRSVRRVRATRLTKMLEAEARVGLRALANWWENSPALSNQLADAGFLPARFPWAARIAGGFLGGVVASVLFPESSSSTDQFPLSMKALRDPIFAARVKNLVNIDQFQRSRNKESAAVRALASPVPDVTLELRDPTTAERLGRILGGYQDIFSIGRLLNPPGWTPIRPGAKVLDANAPGLSGGGGGLRDFIGGGVPGTYAPGGRGPAPAPTSSPTSSPSPSSKPGIFQRVPNLPLMLGLGGIGALAIFKSASRSGNGQLAFNPGLLPPPVITNNPQPVATQTALLVGGYQGGFSSAGAYCEPRPRGPRRKCLERAPVAWRAGRNKGKAAGSKCLRYAQRKS